MHASFHLSPIVDGGLFFASMTPCAFTSRDTVRFVSLSWSEGVPFAVARSYRCARSTPCSGKGGAELHGARSMHTDPILHRAIWGGGFDRLGGIRGRQWKVLIFGSCLLRAREGAILQYHTIPCPSLSVKLGKSLGSCAVLCYCSERALGYCIAM